MQDWSTYKKATGTATLYVQLLEEVSTHQLLLNEGSGPGSINRYPSKFKKGLGFQSFPLSFFWIMGCSSSVPKTNTCYLEPTEGEKLEQRIIDLKNGKRNIVIWSPVDKTCKALILVSHGLHKHAFRHFPIAHVLTKAGYLVIGIDHVGHGKSEGRPGLIADWNIPVNDFVEFAKLMQTENPQLPTFILAHSMGTLVTMLAAPEIPGIRAIVFSATPLSAGPAAASPFGIKALHPLTRTSVVESMTAVMAGVDPYGPACPIENAALTSDAAKQAIHDEDPRIYHGQIMNKTAYELTKMMGVIKSRLPDFKIPYLAIHGSEDQIALPEGSRYLFHNSGTAPDARDLHIFDGLRHEMFHEVAPQCDTVMAKVQEYFDARLAENRV